MSILSLADAKTHLNITDSSSDTELQQFINAAESIITAEIGPLTSTAQEARVDGGTDRLVLPTVRVQTILSISDPYGDVLDLTGIYVSQSGVVEFADGRWFTGRRYTVSYIAGFNPLPPAILHAIKEQLRHLWRTQRGTGRRTGQGSPEMDAMMPAPGSLPTSVEQLIAPYRSFGFA